MIRTPTKVADVPRWKAIYDWLHAELNHYEYGSTFYTVKDVCRKFEVSSITAIRSLNELASEGLIERIQGKGNVVRRLSRQASIRLVIPDSFAGGNRYFTFEHVRRRLSEGVRAAAHQLGIDLDTIFESHIQCLFPRQGESVGFLSFGPLSDEVVDFLQQHQLPYVLADPIETPEGIPYARLDRVQAGYVAARHLLDLGHRRIAWITGPVNEPNFRDRVQGYRQALDEVGIAFCESLITETAPGANGAMEPGKTELALDSLLRLAVPPTAIIAGDDSRAIHILDACRRRGIRVPADLSVLGYPNYPESRLTDPPLTVIDGHYEKTGSEAVRLLLDRIFESNDALKQARLILPELIVRASTGPPTSAHNDPGRAVDSQSVPE